MTIDKPEDLDGLDKEGLIAFLKSDREGKVELWNSWRAIHDTVAVDLAGAVLFQADLTGGINLIGAHLEEVTLIRAQLEAANLIGAHLAGAILLDADLRGSRLGGARLEGADLTVADLTGASLIGAHLTGADLNRAHLTGADLRGVNFRDVALGDVWPGDLRGVKLYGSYFSGMLSLRYTQLLEDETKPKSPSTIWEETEGLFFAAKDVYQNLKGYFEDKGDYEGANWAYEREQVMEKLFFAPTIARRIYSLNPRWRGIWQPDKDETDYRNPHWGEWLRLEIAEKTANYGLSLLRPLICLAAVIIVFALIYWLGGLATAMPECAYGAGSWHEGCAPSSNPVDALVFSLGSLTSTEIAAVQPYRSHVGLIQTVEVLLGIAFTGLFGFVLGNRLRYS